MRPEQLGCWRSHADVWRRVIEEDIETAIVLEDDIDWDLNIHDIFEELSIQMRKGELRKQRATRDEMKSAPYGKSGLRDRLLAPALHQDQFVLTRENTGLDWDLLYIGSLWDIPNVENRPEHQMYDDPFAPNSQEYVCSPSNFYCIYYDLNSVLCSRTSLLITATLLVDFFPSLTRYMLKHDLLEWQIPSAVNSKAGVFTSRTTPESVFWPRLGIQCLRLAMQ